MAVVVLIASVFTGCSADDEKETSEVSIEKESTNEGVSATLPDEAVNEGEQDGGADLLDESGEDIPIIINGAEIQLGKMTAQEIADATGLPNTDKEKIVKVNSEEDVEFDTGNPMNFLTFHVTNYNSYSAEEAKDCFGWDGAPFGDLLVRDRSARSGGDGGRSGRRAVYRQRRDGQNEYRTDHPRKGDRSAAQRDPTDAPQEQSRQILPSRALRRGRNGRHCCRTEIKMPRRGRTECINLQNRQNRLTF
jgi:hypothetical protein